MAMLVPLNVSHVPTWFGTDERTFTPGALTSGLSWSEIGVGPPDEKPAITSLGAPRPFVTAATAIASGALAGEPTVPLPRSLKSFPAAVTQTTPAAVAASIASTTTSRLGVISGSPIEKLSTFMPSLTAASIAAAISGELPSRPSPGVGTVSAL